MTVARLEITILEIFLRVLALVMLGIAVVYIGYQLITRNIRPRLLWQYVGAIATVTLVWRIIVLMFVFFPELRENFLHWITPITAAMYALGGLSLFLLAFCASRRRRTDDLR